MIDLSTVQTTQAFGWLDGFGNATVLLLSFYLFYLTDLIRCALPAESGGRFQLDQVLRMVVVAYEYVHNIATTFGGSRSHTCSTVSRLSSRTLPL